MNKIRDPYVLVNLLLSAYSAEQTEKNVIEEILFWIREKEYWNVLFQIYIDNEIHKRMLLKAMKKLGYKYDKEIEGKTFEFTGKPKEEMLRSIDNWEHFAFNFYKYLLEIIDFEALRNTNIDADGIRKILEELLKWEEKHIEMLRDFFKSTLLFKFKE